MRFAEFELDEPSALLLRNGARVAVTPKAFATLCLLAGNAPRLVTKDELLDTVWGHHHLSESVLKSVISELRAALEDDARNPRFVETVSRRGYRFIGVEPELRAQAPAGVAPRPAGVTARDAVIVGRHAELASLGASWRLAEAGQRQMFWVVGEPGIGKTTLIDHFVQGLGAGVHVARGQCVEQFGVGEPYMPVLEALAGLCAASPDVVRTLRIVAPTWLVRMPWLVGDSERETLRRELAGVGQERMVREFGELLERYAAPEPLLLITDDLHWSDPSTLLLINHVARRRGPARIMWLASFRVAEVLATDHPLQALRRELRLHRHCVEVVLDPFTEQELGTYLQRRFDDDAPDEPLVKRLHRHTDGLPLFVVDVIDALAGGRKDGALMRPFAAGRDALPVPETLSALIDKRISTLSPADQAILQAASICGLDFNPIVAADAAEIGQDDVVQALNRLAQEHPWLRAKENGGEPQPLFAFRHALYRQFFYQRIGQAQRQRLHLRIGECLVRINAPATELAVHFELGGDLTRAARFGAQAAASALRHFAPIEAMDLTAHALSLLARQPGREPTRERVADEVAVLAPRSVAAAHLFGLTAPRTRQALVRMHWLGRRGVQRSGTVAELGLGWMYNLQGKYRRAVALARRVEEQARAAGDTLLHAGACNLWGGSLAFRGEFADAAHWLELGLADFGSLTDAVGVAPFIVDPGVSMHARLGHVLVSLGQIGVARAHVEAALRRADDLRQPFARAFALTFAGIVELRLEEPERVMALTRQLKSAIEGQALAEAQPAVHWLRGWAIARLGDPDAGFDLIQAGRRMQDDLGRIGGGSGAAIAPAVEALMLAGKLEQAATELEAGLAKTRRLGEGLHLLDLLMQQGRLASLAGDAEAAGRHLEAAWSLARLQGAVWLKVEVLMELLRLSPSSRVWMESLRAACSRVVGAEGTARIRRALALLGDRAPSRP